MTLTTIDQLQVKFYGIPACSLLLNIKKKKWRVKNNELQRQLKLSKSASFKKALPIVVIQMLMLIAKLVYNSTALNYLIIHLLP